MSEDTLVQPLLVGDAVAAGGRWVVVLGISGMGRRVKARTGPTGPCKLGGRAARRGESQVVGRGRGQRASPLPPAPVRV